MFIKKPLPSSFLICVLMLSRTFAKAPLEPFPWQAKQVEKKSSRQKNLFPQKKAAYTIGLLLASTIVVGASIYIAKKREEEIAPTSQKDPLAIYYKGFFINKNYVWHQSIDRTNKADITPNDEDEDNKSGYMCNICQQSSNNVDLLILYCHKCTFLACFECAQGRNNSYQNLKNCSICRADFNTQSSKEIFNELRNQTLRNQLKAKQEELRRKTP